MALYWMRYSSGIIPTNTASINEDFPAAELLCISTAEGLSNLREVAARYPVSWFEDSPTTPQVARSFTTSSARLGGFSSSSAALSSSVLSATTEGVSCYTACCASSCFCSSNSSNLGRSRQFPKPYQGLREGQPFSMLQPVLHRSRCPTAEVVIEILGRGDHAGRRFLPMKLA